MLVDDEIAITLKKKVAKSGVAPVEWYFVEVMIAATHLKMLAAG